MCPSFGCRVRSRAGVSQFTIGTSSKPYQDMAARPAAPVVSRAGRHVGRRTATRRQRRKSRESDPPHSTHPDALQTDHHAAQGSRTNRPHHYIVKSRVSRRVSRVLHIDDRVRATKVCPRSWRTGQEARVMVGSGGLQTRAAPPIPSKAPARTTRPSGSQSTDVAFSDA